MNDPELWTSPTPPDRLRNFSGDRYTCDGGAEFSLTNGA